MKQTQKAIITVKGQPEARNVQTKNGQKTIYEQAAQFSTDGTLFQFPLGVASPAEAYALGDYEWNVFADIIGGPYGPELSRRMSLISVSAADKSPTPVASK